MKKSLQKINQKDFRAEKVSKRLKLYVMQKDYDNSLNSWIDKVYVIM